ncbi:MAG: adenylosuccinate synthase [Nitrospirota bacterium]
MKTIVVVGAQWGDEGKGKIVDMLSGDADIIVRYQGGHNAGHTVVIGDQQYILHLIPSGVIRTEKICVIGNGVVVDPAALINEISDLAKKGVMVEKRLFISKKAHLIMPYHRAIERETERQKGARRIGTTGKGIGPAYVDKIARIGIRAADLLEPDIFRDKLSINLNEINYFLENLCKGKGFELEPVYREYLEYGAIIKGYIEDTSCLLNRAIDDGKRVLFEGAQGTHLDIDHGTYPYVTSSSATAGGACTGTGVGPTRIDKVFGIAKAYTTRVGSGPFPSELKDELGARLQETGAEFGATTGRPRRCGWFDAVMVRYSVMVNSISSLAITKLDILDRINPIKICVGYKHRNKVYKDMPSELRVLEEAEPVYEELEGWDEPTAGITDINRLPRNARSYIRRLEDLLSCRVSIISTGSDRAATIILENPFSGKG